MEIKIKSLLIRYFFILLVAVPNFYLFYKIFTPLTIYFSFAFLFPFLKVTLQNNFLMINNQTFEFVNACIAGSAYYLLFTLNLSTPNIKLKKRMKLILLMFASFFIINILRIFLLIFISFNFPLYFDSIHKFFWYFVSVFVVFGIWFFSSKLFQVKAFPFIDDFKFIYSKSLFNKK
jgi:exosortase/archaeosortase family protein